MKILGDWLVVLFLKVRVAVVVEVEVYLLQGPQQLGQLGQPQHLQQGQLMLKQC